MGREMPTWLVPLLSSGGVALTVRVVYALVRRRMDQTWLRGIYDEAGRECGPEHMLAASQALNLKDPSVLARLRAGLRRKDKPPSKPEDPPSPPPLSAA